MAAEIQASSARGRKIFQMRINIMIKKKSVNFFCCYDKKQQIRKFSQDFREGSTLMLAKKILKKKFFKPFLEDL